MMSESSAKIDKLSAARRKLKEFQEQKKLREKTRESPVVNNENINQFSSNHTHFVQQTEAPTNDGLISQNQNGNNINLAHYFLPSTQESPSDRSEQHPSSNQGFYNPNSYNVQSNIQNQQNSNTNATVNIQAYFSDNIYQPENSSGNTFSSNTEPSYSQVETNVENVNKLDNVNSSDTNEINNVHQNQITFQQNSIDDQAHDSNTSPLNENAGQKDMGNTNYNILSVFTDSSTSSHTSSTHTGPFLQSDESPKSTNEMISQPMNEQVGLGKDNHENYHLFEQTHNENYFGINFGNDQEPGIHMNVNPFEHRNEKLVSDFLDFESRPDQNQQDHSQSQESPPIDSSEGLDANDPVLSTSAPINLLNETFRRNLMSLSTSKSTSIEEYTDKSTRGNSTVSKSVSMESSAGGGPGERGGVFFDDILGKDSTNSSTVFSSCDNFRKLLSSAAESSSEPPCTSEEAMELEKKNEELRVLLATEQEKNGELKALLTGEQGKTSGLEAQVNQLRSQHFHQTDSLKHYAVESDQFHTQLKSQTHTIQILIEEKAQLEDKVKSFGEIVEQKGKEIEELNGRLAISKHKNANIERDVGVLQEQVKQSNKALNEITETIMQERKQLEELAEEKSTLMHTLDTKNQELKHVQILLGERDSQLSLMHLKVQQLSAATGMFSSNELSDVQSLQQERDQLRSTINELREQMKTLVRERDKTLQHHVQMIDTLKTKNKELTSLYSSVDQERSSLVTQCQSQISHIAELEKQIQLVRSHNQSPPDTSEEENPLKSLVAEMETKIKDLTLDKHKLDTALQAQVLETELAQERVDQLRREMERLEADRPDANALLTAMESDKIAASRAMQQNSALKQQLQELQDALITLNNTKLELSEQLVQEQTQSKHLRDSLDALQSQLNQQTEVTQQALSQYTESQHQFAELTNQATMNGETHVDTAVEAMEKSPVYQHALSLLEDKFNDAMHHVAELSDEKQRLEHLVTQLQLETETIGEYAALYQKQRYLLQQKAREKDEQVKQLSEDQEALKQKLMKLNSLVQDFVAQGSVPPNSLLESELVASSTALVPAPVESKATEIMELISEIEANRLVVPSTFHPCPVCSGQLITV